MSFPGFRKNQKTQNLTEIAYYKNGSSNLFQTLCVNTLLDVLQNALVFNNGKMTKALIRMVNFMSQKRVFRTNFLKLAMYYVSSLLGVFFKCINDLR